MHANVTILNSFIFLLLPVIFLSIPLVLLLPVCYSELVMSMHYKPLLLQFSRSVYNPLLYANKKNAHIPLQWGIWETPREFCYLHFHGPWSGRCWGHPCTHGSQTHWSHRAHSSQPAGPGEVFSSFVTIYKQKLLWRLSSSGLVVTASAYCCIIYRFCRAWQKLTLDWNVTKVVYCCMFIKSPEYSYFFIYHCMRL